MILSLSKIAPLQAYLAPATAELMALHQYGPGRVAIEGLQQGHLHWTGCEPGFLNVSDTVSGANVPQILLSRF